MKRVFTALTSIVLIFLFCSNKSYSAPIPASANVLLINTWYEEPELQSGDTLVFTLTKHVLQPWDNPAYEFAQLKFIDDTNFTVGYWRACANYNWTYNGTYTIPLPNIVKLNFGLNKCQNQLQIISLTATQLKVLITEQ